MSMPNNDRRFSPLVGLAVAVLGLAGVITAQHLPIRDAVQNDLTERSEQALSAAGLSSVEVSFIGRDGTLRAGSAADADKALEIVRALEGVRVAQAQAPSVAEPAPSAAPSPSAPAAPTSPPEVTLVVGAGGRITLNGRVPSEAARTALVQAATDVAGAGAVDDRLTVDPTVTDKGLAGLPALLAAVGKHSTELTVQLRGDQLDLTGTVDTAATLEAARKAAEAAGVSQVTTRVEATELTQALSDLRAVTFVDDSTVLTPAGKVALTRAAQVLVTASAVKVRIEGHTDSKGTAASNLALSRARANAVLTYLVSKGVAADRLTAVGFGESRPALPNTTEANQAVNRRVEFIVVQ